MTSGDPFPPPNPFSSRYVRPGAIPFIGPAGSSPAQLVERLRDSAWRGQIVGPHGSGKSALLAALMPAIERAGRRVLACELHDGQRHLPEGLLPPAPADDAVAIVDGYEQLSVFSRVRLRKASKTLGLGLVVTAHRPMRLPILCRLQPQAELAQELAAWLLRDYPELIEPHEVAARFEARGGNLREVLFDLYDLFEQRVRQWN